MKATKIPIYIYGGTGAQRKQFASGYQYYLQDDELISKYRIEPDPGEYYHTVYEWRDGHITSLARLINGYLGSTLITKTVTAYTDFDSSKIHLRPAFVNQVLNLLDLYSVDVYNDLPGYPNLHFESVSGSSGLNLLSKPSYDADGVVQLYQGGVIGYSFGFDKRTLDYALNITVYPVDMWDAESGDVKPDLDTLEFHITGDIHSSFEYLTSAKIQVRPSNANTVYYPPINIRNDQGSDSDVTNPFGDDGNDGGDGDNDTPLVDPTDIPELPTVSASDTGLITLYNPTKAQLSSLASFLWSGAFDPDSFKKLFTDPMQCLIGLGIVPAIPGAAGSKNIRFGNVDSGVNCSYLASQYVKVNCGSVSIKKQVGSFLDYTNTSISIYLPYIGFRDLSTDDVMGGSLQVVYNIDVLSGSCSVFIKHSARGVLYNYNGSCITNVPLCANNYSGAIQNAVSTVASGVGVIAGAASGAAPITLASGVAMLNSAANTVMNSKPQIQRSGNLGGSAGILSAQKPFIVIQRPNYSVPDFYNKYVGYMSNKTLKLGDCSGFTMVDWVHLEGIPGTESEVNEIESLLKEGVIL